MNSHPTTRRTDNARSAELIRGWINRVHDDPHDYSKASRFRPALRHGRCLEVNVKDLSSDKGLCGCPRRR